MLVAISVIFGLFYAYFVWNAVEFLVTQASGVVPLNGYGWFVLVFAALFPLAPLIALFIGLADLRIDAKRLVWFNRRPIPVRVAGLSILRNRRKTRLCRNRHLAEDTDISAVRRSVD